MSNNEILREFLLETHENLALLDSDLIALEKNPTDKSTLAQVFRTLHSVKGTAGFIGLVKLQAVAHSAESLLSRLRAGELRFSAPIATVLLRVVDAIREVLASIEATGAEGAGDYTALVAAVDHLRTTGGEQAISPPPAPQAPVTTQPATAQPAAAPPGTPAPVAVVPQPELAVNEPRFTAAMTAVLPGLTVITDTGTAELPEAKAASVAETSIRVDVGLLDKLVTLVGELVLARNQVLQYCDGHADGGFLGVVQRLNLLTSELQTSVMKTRMQPIGNVLNKFPRVVRDLALACGKQVRFEMDGQETELDKTLIEAIRDPLTHMVRNAVDHGIESPSVRRSHGKPEEGRLRMLAFHEGGKVIIEISDDGGGIDVDRVRDKALHAGLVAPEMLARMSRHDMLRLIFLPGFSTADAVTQFSGRGVGMDVVRTNIEKIGGTVDIESTAGQGTTIRTKIPLTLAIIPTLIVASNAQRYAIPQVSLLELVWLDASQAAQRVERIHGAPVFRLRGKLLPLVYLDEQLGTQAQRQAAGDLHIIVLQADDRSFGLVVDTVRDTEEIVVKPLQPQVKGIAVFAGAAILGDGQVALVLDVMGLAQRSGVISGTRSRTLGEQEASPPPAPAATEGMLLFAPRAGGRMAIPLAAVARLEEFSSENVEYVGCSPAAQYRGEILPLIDVSRELDRLAGTNRIAPQTPEVGQTLPVIVCAAGERRVGLIVSRVLDIVAEPIATKSPASRPGVLFAAVLQEKVTEFVDIAALARTALFSQQPAT